MALKIWQDSAYDSFYPPSFLSFFFSFLSLFSLPSFFSFFPFFLPPSFPSFTLPFSSFFSFFFPFFPWLFLKLLSNSPCLPPSRYVLPFILYDQFSSYPRLWTCYSLFLAHPSPGRLHADFFQSFSSQGPWCYLLWAAHGSSFSLLATSYHIPLLLFST